MTTGFSDRDQAEVQPLQRGRLTLSVFRAFVETRPDEEHWELIDGAAMMMTPPTRVHQRIGSNLESLLNDALDRHAPTLVAYQRIGVNIAPEVDNYDLEPDVTVIDANEPANLHYSDRFYLAAEVVSPSDGGRTESKREIYKVHQACRYILAILQDRIEVRLDTRTDAGWQTQVWQSPADVLELPDFGLRCPVGDLYRRTPLQP